MDVAEWLRDLVDIHYAGTERIMLVLDNSRLTPPRRFTKPFRLPKRVAWPVAWNFTTCRSELSQYVGIEIAILSAQCLDRRLPDLPTLDREVEAWTRTRNATGARVRWMFGIEQARTGARLPEGRPDGDGRVNQSKSLR